MCKRVCQNDVNLCDDVSLTKKSDACDVRFNDQCNAVHRNDATANREGGKDCESQFIVPIFVNGIHCKGLRDNGVFVPLNIEKMFPKQHVN